MDTEIPKEEIPAQILLEHGIEGVDQEVAIVQETMIEMTEEIIAIGTIGTKEMIEGITIEATVIRARSWWTIRVYKALFKESYL